MFRNHHAKRYVVLDTETTGLSRKGEVSEGHHLVEVAAIELSNRQPGRTFQSYIKAPIPCDPAAFAVHGISEDFLQDKPTFGELADDLFDFLKGAELIIHNAPFDLSFLNREFARIHEQDPERHPERRIESWCTIFDTLHHARMLFPGKKNSLDALCKRYGVCNKDRTLHGALIDTHLLMQVYLTMTGGQASLVLDVEERGAASREEIQQTLESSSVGERGGQRDAPVIIHPSPEELQAHQAIMARLRPEIKPSSSL